MDKIIALIKKVIAFFKKWDKLAHAFACCLITLFATAIFAIWLSKGAAIAAGATLAFIIGGIKEGIDTMKGTSAEPGDLIADITGIVLTVIPLVIFILV